jgi:hypothetical protein
VHVGRTADAGDPQILGCDFALGLRDVIGLKFRSRGQIHGTLQTAKLDGRKVMRLGEIKDFLPFPGRAT